MDFDGGDLCREPRHVDAVSWIPVPDWYCADLDFVVPWCVAYRVQWVSDYANGPLMHVRWLPEPSGLVPGLILLAFAARRRAVGRRAR